jgi:very-short-patch-repair endonuclease
VTAAFWLGVHDATPRRVHVCTPRQRRSLEAVKVHGRRKVERIIHRRLPVTAPARTLLDIAGVLSFRQLRRAVSEAEYRELVTLEDLEASLGRGRRGSTRLRNALASHRPELARTRSRLEERFFALCERETLPPPAVNVKIGGWTVDAVWSEPMVAVELDGYMAHRTPARLEADRRRELELRAAGYAVLRYTWAQITAAPDQVVADLRRHGVTRTARLPVRA